MGITRENKVLSQINPKVKYEPKAEIATGMFLPNHSGRHDNLKAQGFTDINLTASKPVFTDANKKLSSSGTVPIANGGTNSTSFTSNTVPYYNGTSLVSDTDLQFDGDKLSSKKLRYGNATDYCDFSVEDYAGSGTPIPTITPYWGTSSGLPIALQRGGLFLQTYGGLMSQLFFLNADASLGITMSLDETNSRLNVDYPIQTQGYVASDNSVGISTTITSASLVGKTITIKDGLITGFA